MGQSSFVTSFFRTMWTSIRYHYHVNIKFRKVHMSGTPQKSREYFYKSQRDFEKDEMEHRGWFIGLNGLSPLTIKLRNFGTLQEGLCRELLAARQLGICKTTTLVNGKQDFKSLDSILKDLKGTIKIDIILTNEGSKEMSS